jgi:hypothetical protein
MIDWHKLAKRFPGCEITRGTVGYLAMPGSYTPAELATEEGVRLVVPAKPPLHDAIWVIIPLPEEVEQVIDNKELVRRFIEALGWSLIPPKPAPAAAA